MKAKSETKTAYEVFVCDGDKPTNAECLAEAISAAESFCKDPSDYPVAPWSTKSETLDHLAEMIDNLRAH